MANNAGGTIYVYDDQANFLFQVGNEDNRRNSVAGMFEKPFAIGFGNGYAYVTDVGFDVRGQHREGEDPQRHHRRRGRHHLPATRSRSRSTRPPGQVYVADAGVNQQKIYVYGPTGGTAVRSFGSKGTGNGQFTGLWGVTVANGVVYATDEAQSRVQAFSTTGTFLGKWGGAGTGPYQMRNPSGISHDAQGRVYVADSANDRIAVFDPATAKPAYQFSRPTLTHHLARQQQLDRRAVRGLRAGHRQPVDRERRGLGTRQQHRSLVGPRDRHLDRPPRPGASRRTAAPRPTPSGRGRSPARSTAGSTTSRHAPATPTTACPRRCAPPTYG